MHGNIEFTLEEEKEGILAFLDTEIQHTNNQLPDISIHRKIVFTGLFFNFSSFMPWIYKINLVRILVHRIVTICSNWTIIDWEIRKLTKFLQKNCFPSGVIAQAVNDVLDRFHSSKTENYDVKSTGLCYPFGVMNPSASKLN